MDIDSDVETMDVPPPVEIRSETPSDPTDARSEYENEPRFTSSSIGLHVNQIRTTEDVAVHSASTIHVPIAITIHDENGTIHDSEQANIPSTSLGIPNIGTIDDVENIEDMALDMLTLDDLREEAYAENSGSQYIMMRRDDYLIKLFGIFKDPSFSFYKKPFIEFLGEPGLC